MCGPPDDSYDVESTYSCDFCKKIVDRKDRHEIARPLPPYGRFYYVSLCDTCYKPFSH